MQRALVDGLLDIVNRGDASLDVMKSRCVFFVYLNTFDADSPFSISGTIEGFGQEVLEAARIYDTPGMGRAAVRLILLAAQLVLIMLMAHMLDKLVSVHHHYFCPC